MKNKRMLSWLMAVVLTLCLLPAAALADTQPAEIKTIDDLLAVSDNLSGDYKLVNDLDFADENSYEDKTLYAEFNPQDGSPARTWEPIGRFVAVEGTLEDPNPDYAFSGTFDGGSHTISNLTVDKSFAAAGPYMGAGLFGVMAGEAEDDRAVVQNFTLSAADIKGFCLVGAAVGLQGDNSTVAHVSLTGEANTITGCEGVGGVVGTGAAGKNYTIAHCSAAAVITAEPVDLSGFGMASYPAACAGLIAGGLSGGTMNDCTAAGSVTATGADAYGIGGVVGAPYATAAIENCDATNVQITVEGTNPTYIGGIAGFAGTFGQDEPAAIANCDAENVAISVSATAAYVGGVIGGSTEETHNDFNAALSKLTVTNCTSDESSTISGGAAYVGTLVGRLSSDSSLDANTAMASGQAFPSGDGSAGDPYVITVPAQLAAMNDYLGETLYFELGGNLDLSAYVWKPVGTFAQLAGAANETPDPAYAFCGSFDGDGYKITGLTIQKSFADAGMVMGTGLFGCAMAKAPEENRTAIYDLTLDAAQVNGFCLVGAAVGFQYSGCDVKNILVTNSTVTGCEGIGSVVGTGAGDGKVQDCHAKGITIQADPVDLGQYGIYPAACAGVIAGGLTGGLLSGCTAAESSVTATGDGAYALGGVVGAPYATAAIENCGATAVQITAKGLSPTYIGGITGFAGTYGQEAATVISGCAVKNVTITVANTAQYVGGIIGGSKEETHGDTAATLSQFVVSSCTISDSAITGGTAYLGAVVGRLASGCINKVTSGEMTINGSTANLVGSSSSNGSSGSGGSGSNSNSNSSSSGGSASAYTIAVSAMDKGTLRLSKASAVFGDTVTITIQADSGYQLDKLTVRDARGQAVTVSPNSDGTYSFKMPNSKVTVAAVFKEAASAAGVWQNPFEDVAAESWYYEAVRYSNENGLLFGTDTTTFSPELPMTRAMIWAVLGRLDGQIFTASGGFDDVKNWAVQKKISDGTQPDAHITREQLAAMLYRYAKSPATSGTLEAFADAEEASDYARDALCWAVEQGLLAGKGGGILEPQGSATRAQAAAILMRYDQLSK